MAKVFRKLVINAAAGKDSVLKLFPGERLTGFAFWDEPVTQYMWLEVWRTASLIQSNKTVPTTKSFPQSNIALTGILAIESGLIVPVINDIWGDALKKIEGDSQLYVYHNALAAQANLYMEIES